MKPATGCQSDFLGRAPLSSSLGNGLGEMEKSVFASMETKREIRSRVPAEPVGTPGRDELFFLLLGQNA